MILATRQRTEGSRTLESYVRDDRLQSRDADRIAANVGGGKYVIRMGLHAGERNNPCSPAFASILNPSPASRVRWRQAFACPSMSIELSRVCIELTCGWRTVDKTAPACRAAMKMRTARQSG